MQTFPRGSRTFVPARVFSDTLSSLFCSIIFRGNQRSDNPVDCVRIMSSFVLARFIALLCALLASQIEAKAIGSLLFLDNANHRFFRSDSSIAQPKRDSMTHSDFAATISVLLGFAPFTSDSTLSSSKLDGLLLPNPFDRPRAVFMLDARGISEELLSEVGLLKLGLDAYSYRTLIESNRVAIELPEDEVIMESLNKASDAECGATCIDQELVDLASWLGGSYVGAQEPLHGKLDIPVSEGSFLSLDLSKRADQTFATELVSLLRNIRSAVAMHEDLAESSENPAELLMGSFVGVEALQEQYGPGDICLKGSELFLNVAVKLFRSLQLQYGGQIAGVIAINGNVFPASEGMFDIKLSLRGSRWLTELGPSTSPTRSNSTLAEIKLVRNSLAWSTAIILLIAALIGVYYLFNMPLTRDTLLYSNVKLD